MAQKEYLTEKECGELQKEFQENWSSYQNKAELTDQEWLGDIEKAIRETNSLMELMGDNLKTLTQEYEKRKYKNASIR